MKTRLPGAESAEQRNAFFPELCVRLPCTIVSEGKGELLKRKKEIEILSFHP